MKKLAKRIMIYSMVGMMQIGLGATVVAASPLYNDGPQRIVQLDGRYYNHYERRRHYEREREWRERRYRENHRYDNTTNEITAGVIGFILGSATN